LYLSILCTIILNYYFLKSTHTRRRTHTHPPTHTQTPLHTRTHTHTHTYQYGFLDLSLSVDENPTIRITSSNTNTKDKLDHLSISKDRIVINKSGSNISTVSAENNNDTFPIFINETANI